MKADWCWIIIKSKWSIYSKSNRAERFFLGLGLGLISERSVARYNRWVVNIWDGGGDDEELYLKKIYAGLNSI